MLSFAPLSHFSVQNKVNSELKRDLRIEAIEVEKTGKLMGKQFAIIY